MSVELGWVSPDPIPLRSAAQSVDAMEQQLLATRPEYTPLESNVRANGGYMELGIKVPGDQTHLIDEKMLSDGKFYATVGRGHTTIRTQVLPGQMVEQRFEQVFGPNLDGTTLTVLVMEATLSRPNRKPQLAGVVSCGADGLFWTTLVGQITLMIRNQAATDQLCHAALDAMNKTGDAGGISLGYAIAERLSFGDFDVEVLVGQICKQRWSIHGVIADLVDGPPSSVTFFRSIDHPDRTTHDSYLFYADTNDHLVWASLPSGIKAINSDLRPIGLKQEEMVTRRCQPRLL